MIEQNLRTIREAIHRSAERAGRDPSTIQLVAVSKKKGVSLIREAFDCGQTVFGENYLQEAAEKIPLLPEEARWHFIGRLQSNKAKQIVSLFDVVETVYNIKGAKLLHKHSEALGKSISILIQVNIGREGQKSGVFPEEAQSLLEQIKSETALRVQGLMILPPYMAEPEANRPLFTKTRRLGEEFAEKGLFENNERFDLSMGMSGDFEVAIEEGATLVRIGTALFGERVG